MLYALAGLYDEERGWGIRGEGFVAADAAGAWFRVGDRDLALCRERAGWLDAGVGRAEVARRLCERLGVAALVVPATAEACRTEVLVAAGAPGSGVAGAATGGVSGLPLQEWLVRERAALPPLGLRVVPPAPRATQEAVAAVEGAELVVLGPSSPLMSLLPLLAAPELAAAVARAPRVVALSPTVRAIAPRTPAEAGRYRVRGLAKAQPDQRSELRLQAQLFAHEPRGLRECGDFEAKGGLAAAGLALIRDVNAVEGASELVDVVGRRAVGSELGCHRRDRGVVDAHVAQFYAGESGDPCLDAGCE